MSASVGEPTSRKTERGRNVTDQVAKITDALNLALRFAQIRVTVIC